MDLRISIRRSFLLFCSFSLPLLASASTTDTPTTCYVIDGTHNYKAGYRCDNSTTGHSSCCQAGAICFSNGVCQQANGNAQDYLRVGCTDPTWKDPSCLNQCTIYARGSTAGIRFCNGAITSTTEYCCDPGGNGVGSFACCKNDTNIFNISPVATVLAQVPLNYVSSSTSSTSTSSASTSTTTSASNTITTSSASETSTTILSSPTSTSTPHTAAIGVGVGIPCGILALGLLGYFFWRRKRAQKIDHVPKNHEAGYPATEGGYDTQGEYTIVQGEHSASASEIGSGYARGNLGEVVRDDKSYLVSSPLSEMEAGRTVHEMDGGGVGGKR
ncbi:hypothetical protein SBOR_8569 [Sclerotinia borealis F-4128]|uniref:Mid2 domain-containing protein n=1 Tax=Sclerotinia borealis (strain F-4128) TaxID=1432307 RepID=W9C8Z8_SCLBF|nr:hypothetical protein SBOR_8569 [Sclerotinia borealis F-4128]